jgi:hypothetical protein
VLVITDVRKLANGSLGLKAGLSFVPEVVVVVVFVVAGFSTRDMARSKAEEMGIEMGTRRGVGTRDSERGLKGAVGHVTEH